MQNKGFSIVVVTYNFEKIILECLDGIEKQTYKNFEVIISDDASKDKTVEICEKWKEKVKDQIVVTIIKNKKNEGVTKNINKGIKLATKEWVKIVAGDDILREDALENINFFINNNLEAKIIASKAQLFCIKNGKRIDLEVEPKNKEIYTKSTIEQFKRLLEGNFILAPTVVIKNSLLKDMNYFDEKYKMVEDYPFWLKSSKNNIKFYFLDKIIIDYRQSSSSVSGKKEEEVNPLMFEFEKQIYEDIYLKEVKNPFKRWDKYIDIKSKEIILKNNNKKNFFSKMIRKLRMKKLKKLVIKILILFIIYYLVKYFKII
ncbi:glycosyltransferase [uncultured Fusobacterium sp.]|uniref:glycosyltransferase n=1 Tax=uncultured Fusobacterium sp. TaxID=159267 RepID=UPI0025ECCC7F|nr:glycosyltransferase [uncultured Fusobacterium sp.]